MRVQPSADGKNEQIDKVRLSKPTAQAEVGRFIVDNLPRFRHRANERKTSGILVAAVTDFFCEKNERRSSYSRQFVPFFRHDSSQGALFDQQHPSSHSLPRPSWELEPQAAAEWYEGDRHVALTNGDRLFSRWQTPSQCRSLTRQRQTSGCVRNSRTSPKASTPSWE